MIFSENPLCFHSLDIHLSVAENNIIGLVQLVPFISPVTYQQYLSTLITLSQIAGKPLMVSLLIIPYICKYQFTSEIKTAFMHLVGIKTFAFDINFTVSHHYISTVITPSDVRCIALSCPTVEGCSSDFCVTIFLCFPCYCY